MKKFLRIIVVCFLVAMCFAGCTTSKDNTETTTVNLVGQQSINEVLSSDKKWDVQNFLPEGFEKTTVLGESGDQMVYEATASVPYETVSTFYSNLAKEKSASINIDDDFTVFQWQEDNVEVYIKASKIDDNNTVITVDYYNGSINP